MEVAILNTTILLVVILIQWAHIREKNKVISELEKDNEFWIVEYNRYATMYERMKTSLLER